MNFDKYPVAIGKTSMVYEFISIGFHGNIPKLVIYSETEVLNIYNLGFGDKNETTGEIDDLIVTNNGDSIKILATVASTLYTFTDCFPESLVFATGSTKARTRLYQMGIANNIEQIKSDFEVFGLLENDDWIPFEKGIQFVAFLVKRKILILQNETENES